MEREVIAKAAHTACVNCDDLKALAAFYTDSKRCTVYHNWMKYEVWGSESILHIKNCFCDTTVYVKI